MPNVEMRGSSIGNYAYTQNEASKRDQTRRDGSVDAKQSLSAEVAKRALEARLADGVELALTKTQNQRREDLTYEQLQRK